MSRKQASRLLVFAAAAFAVGVAAVYRQTLTQQNLAAALQQLGPWGHGLYLLGWLIAPALMLPGSIITLAGGALFGPVLGTVYTSLGSTAGATLAFLLARYLAGDWVARRSGGGLGRIQAGVEAEGWRFVAFTRLVPLFPFNLLNYAFGLTRIRLTTFVLTSWVCMLPGTAGYVYIGYAAREAALGGTDLVRKGIWALAVLAVLLLVPAVLRRLRAPAGGRTLRGGRGAMPGDLCTRRS